MRAQRYLFARRQHDSERPKESSWQSCSEQTFGASFTVLINMRVAVPVGKHQECGLFKERALLLLLYHCSEHFLRERRKNSTA